MALQADNIADLVTATLKDLGRFKITEIATDIQRHVAMRNLLNKNRVTFDSGYGIQWQVMVTNSGNAAFTGLYASDNVNVGDVLKSATVPWRHGSAFFAYEDREISMNGNPARIVDLLKVRRLDAMIAWAELMETRFWALPASTDDVNPYGVPYYIVKSNSEGFNGTLPSGYSDVAGLSPTTYPRWTNYTAQYTLVTKDDLVRKWRKAALLTDWQPPVDGIPTYNTGDMYGWYSTQSLVQGLEELLEAQNDRLGTDVASMDGKTLFKRTPVTYVSKLDADTTNPIYGINWGIFKTTILRGEWMRQTEIKPVPGQHRTNAVFFDTSLNWTCKDRRRNMVLATTTGLP